MPRATVPAHLFPFHADTVDVGGLEMAYVEAGTGPPVVMVHGNPTWSFFYRHLIAALAADHRAIAPDHIGMGMSARPTRTEYPFTLARRIADFGAFIDRAVPTGSLSLVVHDWGGAIGMGWAVDHADRVDRLVVLNTAAFHTPVGRKVPGLLHAARSVALGELAVRGVNAFVRGAVLRGASRSLSDDEAAGYLAPYSTWHRRLGVYEFVRDIPVGPAHRTYPTVTGISERLENLAGKQMLIGWGMRDFVFDERFLNEWIRRFPDAEVHRYPSGGHLVLDDAADELVPAIQKFLS
ncbi:MAG: alpha/beta fold hydrolase [Acidimicrobiia bacterium]|nr:alpha/beta fold hydrolase [Acidimicrobiia bacterium]